MFYSSDDHRFQLELLGRQARRHGARILGCCLMTNHVHLVVVPEREDSLALNRAHTLPHTVDPPLDRRGEESVGRWDHAEWREILAAGMEGGEGDAVRRATYAGEPLGSEEFVTKRERQAARRLRVLSRGHPRK